MTTQTIVEQGQDRVDHPGCVVAGFDGSRSSAAAVDWAAREADRRKSSLRIVTCWVVPKHVDFYGVGARRVDDLADVAGWVRDRYPGLIVEESATNLDPRDALVAASGDADLMVVGASEAGTAKAWLSRSVSRSTARRSACPVVVVRGEGQRAIRRIFVAVDSSSAALAALDWAAEEAGRHGAELVIVHAWQRPGDGRSVRAGDLAGAEAQRIVDVAIERCRVMTEAPVSGRLVEGPASEALIAASRDADLIAVGSRGRSGFTTMLFGSVALAVAEGAACPVAITHPRLDPPYRS